MILKRSKKIFLEWSQSVDINCVTKLLDYKSNLGVQFIWLLILFGSTGATFYLIAVSIMDYLKYDVITKIAKVNEIPAKLPAITFCDYNPFSSIKAQEFMEENSTLLKNIFNSSESLKLTDHLASSKTFGDENRMSLGNFRPNEQFRCVFKDLDDCTNDLKWYWSFDYGNCYQFNTKEKEMKLSRSGSEFGPKINVYPLFNLNKYVSRGSSGLVLFVHEKKLRPKNEVFLKYGEMTYVSVNRVFTQKYPSPYSECIDQTAYKSDLFDFIIKSNRTYRQEDCFDLCIQKSIIDKCQCYYTKYDDLNNGSRPCLNKTDLECLDKQIDNFNSEECQSNSCPLECDSFTYDLSFSSLEYPDEAEYEKYFKNTYDYLNMTYDLFKSSSAFFTVYYSNLQYTQISESPKTQIIDLFTQVGGALGMFVSFSVFTLFEFIEIGILLLKNLLIGSKRVGTGRVGFFTKAEELRNKYKKIFDSIDTDHDGKLIAANVSELNKYLTTPIELGDDMDWDGLIKMCPSNTVTRDEHNKFGNVGTGTVFGFDQFLWILKIDGQILEDESSGNEKEKELFYLFASQPGSKMSWTDLNTINNMILPLLKDEYKPIAEKHFAPNLTKLLTYSGNFIKIMSIIFDNEYHLDNYFILF